MRAHGFVCLSLALVACSSEPSDDADSSTSTAPTTSTSSSSGETSADSSDATSSSGPGTTDTSTSSSSADSSSGDPDSSSSTTEPVAFALTSTAFAEGGGIPGVHHISGGNESPPLAWEGAPAGTMSFALFFHDTSIDFEHSAIWNISADTIELPQDIDHVAMPRDVPGAVQCENWAGSIGYGGPGSAANFYQFTLYAVDVAALPEIDADSNLIEIRAAFEAHSLGTAILTGQSTGP